MSLYVAFDQGGTRQYQTMSLCNAHRPNILHITYPIVFRVSLIHCHSQFKFKDPGVCSRIGVLSIAHLYNSADITIAKTKSLDVFHQFIHIRMFHSAISLFLGTLNQQCGTLF
jgi:hypothetical protein